MNGKWVAVVTIAFVAILIAIGDLAWATAVATSAPWFSATVSTQTYVASLLASTLLVVGLAIVASIRIVSIRRGISELDHRIALARRNAGAQNAPSIPAGPTDREIEDELDEVLGTGDRDASLVEVSPETARVIPAAAATPDTSGLLRDAMHRRMALRKDVSRVRWAVSGPIVATIAFAAIASVMLPTAEGFALRNFQVNTALVLFLSYGWPFLVTWSVCATAVS